MMADATVKVVREVDTDALILQANKEALPAAMFAVHATVSARSPLDTGNLVGSMQPGAGVTEVHPSGEWARVGTNVDYGRTLNEAGDTRYREHKSYAGQKTQSWFDKGVADADLGKAVTVMASAIENGWKR